MPIVEIDPGLLERAREVAASRGETIEAFVTDAVRQMVDQNAE